MTRLFASHFELCSEVHVRSYSLNLTPFINGDWFLVHSTPPVYRALAGLLFRFEVSKLLTRLL